MTDPLTPERFREIEALFDRAMALDPGAREALLGQVDCQDAELADAVRRLLVEDARADSLPDVERGLALALGEVARDRTTLGPFRLERRLGAGGMGVVYEAVQESPIQRRVAIKLLKLGSGNEELATRFRAEARALARLSHPNVAQVFEAGTSEDGQPFLVMELIQGLPITRYCEEHQLGLDARIELMLAVCRGVQHAHQRGIVHRDLKPANLLVADPDGRAIPKIIDFGVAKTLVADDDAPAMTRRGEAVGTLEYMSPEQTGGMMPADTRSDVYALGVVLYELLTGELPIARGRFERASLEEAYRAIREIEPLRPSRLVAARGSTDPSSHGVPVSARRLRGDLDWITLKALDKDPDRRYGTVSEMAADLERFLRNEPIIAGPPSALYRVQKLVWRHRWAVAGAALLLLASLVASAGLAVGMMRARHAEAAARVDAETSRHVADFLVQVFASADPREGQGGETPVREVVDRAVSKIGDLEIEPKVQSRLLDALGKVYANLGLYAEARVHLERALELRERDFGAESIEVADTLLELASLLRRLDLPDESEAAYRRALAIQERHFGPNSAELAETLNGLAVVVRAKAPDEAYALYQRSLQVYETEHGPEHPNIIRLRVNLASLDARSQRFEAAAIEFAAALELAERVLGPGHADLGAILGNFAFVQRMRGHYRHSRALLERALELEIARLGEDHPNVSYTRINLVAVCQRLGDLGAARIHGEAALRTLGATLPDHHQLLATARNNHAATLAREGHWSEAIALAEQARTAVADRNDSEARTIWLRSTLMRSGVERMAGRPETAADLATAALAALAVDPVAVPLELEARWAHAHALAAAQDPDALPAAQAARDLATSKNSGAQHLHEARYAALTGDRAGAFASLQRAVAELPADAGWLTDPELQVALQMPEAATLTADLQRKLDTDPAR